MKYCFLIAWQGATCKIHLVKNWVEGFSSSGNFKMSVLCFPTKWSKQSPGTVGLFCLFADLFWEVFPGDEDQIAH